MKNNTALIILSILACIAFYFWGKKNGSNNTNVSVANNVAIIKEIAELASLNVAGNTTVNSTNKESGGIFSELKNLFGEKTINITIPYEAKYGVDMSKQNAVIDTKAGTATIYLPEVKLLSLQLQLDKTGAMSQTGLMNQVTLDDYVKAHKTLYSEARKTLEKNANYQKLAQEHIRFILEKYYQPLGLEVKCVFGSTPADILK